MYQHFVKNFSIHAELRDDALHTYSNIPMHDSTTQPSISQTSTSQIQVSCTPNTIKTLALHLCHAPIPEPLLKQPIHSLTLPNPPALGILIINQTIKHPPNHLHTTLLPPHTPYLPSHVLISFGLLPTLCTIHLSFTTPLARCPSPLYNTV